MSNEKQLELIRKRLTEMKGKTLIYGALEHKIINYSIDIERTRIELKTSKNVYDRDFDSTMEFLDQFTDPLVTKNNSNKPVAFVDAKDALSVQPIQINSEVISQLKTILIENIEKVKKDREYIPQAAAVKQNVDGIIELAKIEVSYIEAYCRIKNIK